MNARDYERTRLLLQRAFARSASPPVPRRDLWPELRQRIRATPQAGAKGVIPWFDWALGGALITFVLLCPAAVPVLLFYL